MRAESEEVRHRGPPQAGGYAGKLGLLVIPYSAMNFLFTVASGAGRYRWLPRVALRSTGDLGFEHVADGTCVIWQASRADIT